MVVEPYKRGSYPTVQFYNAKADLEIITKGIIDCLAKDGDMLLVADDWCLYREEEMSEIMAIRNEVNENRWVLEAPGHALKKADGNFRERLLRFMLSARSGWSAYIYAFPSQTILLLWEGDIIDLWTLKSGVVKKFDAFLKRTKTSS
jgi:hypothetical protein